MKDTQNRIELSSGYCVLYGICYGGLLLLSLSLSIHFGYLVVKAFVGSSSILNGIGRIALGCVFMVVFLWLAKSLLPDFLSCIRLFGLQIVMTDDGIIIRKDTHEYSIGKQNSVVLYSMIGWLIVWRSEGETSALLLRRRFMSWHYKVLRPYLKEKMNYVSEEKAKKKIINQLHINENNPGKYIHWPIVRVGPSDNNIW